MKRKTRRMNVYLILPTSHMDELQLLKTKKALKDFTTQPVIQTGLEFWIEEPNATEGTITGIAVLTTRKNDVTTLLNLCASSRLRTPSCECSGRSVVPAARAASPRRHPIPFASLHRVARCSTIRAGLVCSTASTSTGSTPDSTAVMRRCWPRCAGRCQGDS